MKKLSQNLPKMSAPQACRLSCWEARKLIFNNAASKLVNWALLAIVQKNTSKTLEDNFYTSMM